MDQGMLGKVEALRDEAYAVLKALDDAVASLGGQRRIPSHLNILQSIGHISNRPKVEIIESSTTRRVSQGGAAEMILIERGEPMTGAGLMKLLPTKGASVGGTNALVNFTSALSKSDKFYSFRRGGIYYWWLSGVPLPAEWQEASDLLSIEGSDASVVSNQEGGEANATAT